MSIKNLLRGNKAEPYPLTRYNKAKNPTQSRNNKVKDPNQKLSITAKNLTLGNKGWVPTKSQSNKA